MRPWLAVLVALLALLSGCTGPKDGASAVGGAEGEATDGVPDDLALAPLVLASSVPLNGTVAIDATFPLADTCNSNPARGCVERSHDLGAQLPPGVPVEVAVDITWTAGEGMFHMEAWVDGEGMRWLRVDNTTLEAGHWRWSALLVPGQTSQAVVISGGPQSAAQPSDSPYHLEVTFAGSNQTVPGFIPVAVEMGPNGTLSATSFTGAPPKFLLYGPDDQFLEEVTGNVTLPADAARGDYIALPRERVTFLVPGGGTLRFVGVTFTDSGPVAIPSGSAATVTVTSPTPPFVAGAYYYGQQQTPFMVAAQIHLTLTDPAGKELLTQQSCQPFCFGGFNNQWGAGLGTALPAGGYTATVDSQAAVDTYAGAFVGLFDRAGL